MEELKKGISLIVLVITIIIIIILAAAIILSISSNNPVENARKAVFLNDLKAIEEEVKMYELNKYQEALEKKEEYVATTIDKEEMTKLFSSTKNYDKKVKIENGKVVLIENELTNEEKEWASNSNFQIITTDNGEDKIKEENKYGIFNDYYELALNKVKTLNIDQKIKQMLLVFYDSNNTSNDYGGILFFEKDFKDKDEAQVKAMVNGLNNTSNIPFLMAVDEEGKTGTKGVIRVSSNSKLTSSNPYLKGNPFPNSQTLYANGGFDLIKTDTIEKSKFLYNLGLNLDLAPVADICNVGDYMYNRSIGLDAAGTSKYVETVIRASKEAKNDGYKVSYCLKHFPRIWK